MEDGSGKLEDFNAPPKAARILIGSCFFLFTSLKCLKTKVKIIFLVFFVANFIRFCPNFWVDFWEESIGFNVGFNFGDFQFIGYIHGLFENISTTDDEDVFVNFLTELNRFFNASYDENSLFEPILFSLNFDIGAVWKRFSDAFIRFSAHDDRMTGSNFFKMFQILRKMPW